MANEYDEKSNKIESNSKYAGYIPVICKKCGDMFSYYDKFGEYNEVPPDKRFLCPKCVKAVGKQNKTGRLTPEQFLKNSNIKDKIVCREFKKICKNKIKGRSYKNILKEAIEVASYFKEDNNGI